MRLMIIVLMILVVLIFLFGRMLILNWKKRVYLLLKDLLYLLKLFGVSFRMCEWRCYLG